MPPQKRSGPGGSSANPPPQPGHRQQPFRLRAYYKSLAPLVSWTRAARPIDWTEYFEHSGPVQVEIGYGNGESLVRRALAQPDINIVGLELAWASTKRALRRLAKSGAANVRLLQVDAKLAFKQLFTPRTIERVYALFPIPWPKDRHAKRRLFNREFLRLVGSRLIDGGEIQIITDFQPYLDWVMTQIPDTGLAARWDTTTTRFETKYERKWLENGQDSFFEIILKKEEHLDVSLVEDTPLFAPSITDFDPKKFNPTNIEGRITVKFQDFLYDPERRRAMIRALVVEDNLMQDVWLQIKDEGESWRLSLAPGGQILPTDGVKQALELARDGCRNAAVTQAPLPA